MTFNIAIRPATDFPASTKATKDKSELTQNREQFVDTLGTAILQAEESGEELVLAIPLDGPTSTQNQLTSVKRYAAHAAGELGVTVRVKKVRDQDIAVVQLVTAEATAEATA